MRSIRKPLLWGLLLLALLLVGYGLTRFFACTASLPNQEGRMFSLTLAAIQSIRLVEEDSQTEITLTDRADIAAAAEALNALRYDSCAFRPESSTDGNLIFITLYTGQTVSYSYTDGVSLLPQYTCTCDTSGLDVLFS